MSDHELLLTTLKLASAPLLMLLNRFFVAAEFALVKIRGKQLKNPVATGYRRVKTARRIVHSYIEYAA
jgi:CBS domain containing-hemolysin-like protein